MLIFFFIPIFIKIYKKDELLQKPSRNKESNSKIKKVYPAVEEEIPSELKDSPGGVFLMNRIDQKLGMKMTGEPIKVKYSEYKLAIQCKFRVDRSQEIKLNNDSIKNDEEKFIRVERSSDIRPYGFLIFKI